MSSSVERVSGAVVNSESVRNFMSSKLYCFVKVAVAVVFQLYVEGLKVCCCVYIVIRFT